MATTQTRIPADQLTTMIVASLDYATSDTERLRDHFGIPEDVMIPAAERALYNLVGRLSVYLPQGELDRIRLALDRMEQGEPF